MSAAPRPDRVPAPARRHGGRAAARLALCLLLAACGGPGPGAPHQRIIVPKRASMKTVAESLAAHRIIASPERFLLKARLLGVFVREYRGLDRHLRPGRYDFPVGERTRTILSAMLNGRTDDDLFTVPEGFTIREMAEVAAQRLGMDTAAFLAATRDPALRASLRIPAGDTTLEGYLFPESYRVVSGASPEQLVTQMVQQFQSQWDTAWDARAREIGFTRHQVITLASIVEAEARRHFERQLIAGVYYNRLMRRHPMKLEADPTVIYALGHHVNRVLLRDLEVRSPYNTYLHTGLPPGPIDSPGRASILAVLWPARHRFLFFVARPDGSHMFSETAAQHADSVRVARQLRAAAIAAKAESLRVARRDSIAAVRAAQQLRRLPPPSVAGGPSRLDSAATHPPLP